MVWKWFSTEEVVLNPGKDDECEGWKFELFFPSATINISRGLLWQPIARVL